LEAHDASDVVLSAAEERAEHQREERFRRGVALWVAVLAMVLAITSMGREHAGKEAINANIHASDTYNFFQAKNIRQTDNQLAADDLETLLVLENPPEPLRSRLQQRLDGYKANVARYESEPSTGEGKTELLAEARRLETERDEAQQREHSFNYSQALLQIAIVLGSVVILSLSRVVLALSGVVAVVAAVLLTNGYLALYDLPI
jgi:hypothetical protein